MMHLEEAALAAGGMMLGADAAFSGVSTDSRSVAAGELFVALKGERFDGHDYVAEVLAKGAAGAMVEHAWAQAHGAGLPLVAVEDTKRALGRLAGNWRGRFDIPVIAVTGSNGKTTVKEMIAAILAAEYGAENRLATAGNLNNDIGLPLTLLRLRQRHRAAVIEMGMNHPGETAELAAICRPTIALINNAQREHQEFMKSVAAVAAEHGAVIAALPPGGIAVINADDEFADYWRGLAAGRGIRDFGLDQPAAVSAGCRIDAEGMSLDIAVPAGRVAVQLAAAGLHNVRNALAAVAAATAAGAGLPALQRGLESFRAVKGRLQQKPGSQGAAVIDDTYNANPDSVRAAVDVLAALPGKRILVLGDMGEVGEKAGQFHDEAGGYAKSMGLERLFALGEHAAAAAHNFGTGASHFARVEDLIAALRPELGQGVTVLVKGSRFMRMERVVEAITEDNEGIPNAA
ncbi:MAG: UDP-N-acetylmuramoyl-tripeptide--D-alanyl-D-alanine ligase [Rhodocyclales bacterium GWA2_65_20]|nr:MAG: UDP-N-acetylmuramoyl-tripeptide--D-alanyl-D-alanine ligase [Rhodocyclales bacterium GWA2_65_20]